VSLLVELLPSLGPALVVGGGQVAERKVRGLVEAGFRVTVVAPAVLDAIRAQPGVEVHTRPFAEADVDGHALVFACTNAREVNRHTGEAARRAGIPAVVADSQAESTAFTPAVFRDGALTIAVSTGGASPVVAREIRDRVAAALGEGWAARIEAARAERQARLAATRPDGGDE
jgi:siroheme synthase-like protein